jgi:sialate O-acetylesterase
MNLQFILRHITLSFIIFILSFQSAECVTLFSPPSHDYYKHYHFTEDDLEDWTYEGNREDFNFNDEAIYFKQDQFEQRAILNKKLVENLDSYGMEFTMEIEQMGEAGDRTRPILMIIPRSVDADFQDRYAVTYYLETLRMGLIVANLYQVHWAIINTNNPTDMDPLVSGSYIMNEGIKYNGRLSIENLPDGDVDIQFFVDGPTDPTQTCEPLLHYRDSSIYKLRESAVGPTFATVGYDDDSWGVNPVLKIDNLKLYSIEAFKERTYALKQYAKIWISESILGDRYKNVKYLTNNRMILTTMTGDLELDRPAYADEMLFSLHAIDDGDFHKAESFYNASDQVPLTRDLAAQMIYAYEESPPIIEGYKSVLKDAGLNDNHLHYVYQNGLFSTENGNINPGQLLTRNDYINLVVKLVNPKARIENQRLFLPDIIGTNAVIQRDRPIKIWGNSMSDDTVTVTFANQEALSLVKDGKWFIELNEMSAGGPYTMTIRDSSQTIEYTDIYIGEVFIVAGQSNAEMPLKETRQVNSIMKRHLNRDHLRFFYNDFLIATTPNKSANGSWFKSQEWVLEESPAIGTYCADYLLKFNKDLRGVKIGIIRLTYGGSTIELFLQPDEVSEMIYKQKHHHPLMSGFWNGFMDYIPPYQIRGVFYYQGENSSQLKHSYEPLLRKYINGLRKAFQNPDLPIILVQIAGYGENFYITDNDSWPRIREVQMRVANTTENVELVTAIDLVDPNPLEIHPIDKKPIGRRLAYMALELIYNKPNLIRSPVIRSSTLEAGTYTLELDYLGKGIVFKDMGPDDFEILDDSGHWHPANSKIKGDNIIVWSDQTDEPLGVRYAWRNYPSSTYYNSYDLPLLPYNSTVNLYAKDTKHLETNTFQVKISNHLLQTFDAIENVTRAYEFRMVRRKDANIVTHDFFVYNQQPGDLIRMFRKLSRVYAADGTTEEYLVIRNHELEVGDWIRNNSKGWTARKILEVIDRHTVRVNPVPNQSAGDLIERYRFIESVLAE